MNFHRRIVVAAVAGLAAFGAQRSVASPDAIAVIYTQGNGFSAGIKDPEAAIVSYDLAFGNRFMIRSHFVRNDQIAKSIHIWSNSARRLFITLGVDQPERTSFSAVGDAAETLRQLAQQHAAPDCKVEVVVFPITVRVKFADVPTAKADEGKVK
jgi:hypothetical protein